MAQPSLELQMSGTGCLLDISSGIIPQAPRTHSKPNMSCLYQRHQYTSNPQYGNFKVTLPLPVLCQICKEVLSILPL